jgi:hypothetical protein
VACVCRVVLQTDGATPLFIASQKGHVECARALLDGGAAINQAMVGFASSMARHCGDKMCWDAWETCAAGRELALRLVEGLGKRWSSQCFTCRGGEHLDDRVRHTCDR